MIFDWDTCCPPGGNPRNPGGRPCDACGGGALGRGAFERAVPAGRRRARRCGRQRRRGRPSAGLRKFYAAAGHPLPSALALRLEGLAVEEFLKGLPRPRFVDSAACPNAAEQLARLCAGMETADPAAQPDPARGAAPYALLCMLAHADEETRRLSPIVAEAVESIRNNYMALYGVEDLGSSARGQQMPPRADVLG